MLLSVWEKVAYRIIRFLEIAVSFSVRGKLIRICDMTGMQTVINKAAITTYVKAMSKS